MDLSRFRRFTQVLTESLASRADVVGLVAMGSMAEQDYAPDAYSDHDFWVVVDGDAERWRRDLAWLPDAGAVLIATRETPHGLKVVHRDGHLLEFAVFARHELHVARAGRSRVLIDRGGSAEAIAAVWIHRPAAAGAGASEGAPPHLLPRRLRTQRQAAAPRHAAAAPVPTTT